MRSPKLHHCLLMRGGHEQQERIRPLMVVMNGAVGVPAASRCILQDQAMHGQFVSAWHSACTSVLWSGLMAGFRISYT